MGSQFAEATELRYVKALGTSLFSWPMAKVVKDYKNKYKMNDVGHVVVKCKV